MPDKEKEVKEKKMEREIFFDKEFHEVVIISEKEYTMGSCTRCLYHKCSASECSGIYSGIEYGTGLEDEKICGLTQREIIISKKKNRIDLDF